LRRALWLAWLLAACTGRPAAKDAPAPAHPRALAAAPAARAGAATSAGAAPPAPSTVDGGAGDAPPAAFGGPGTRSVAGTHGVVVSAEPFATRAGVSVLEAGGNAVDAAVATALALAVTHPSAGNLGGGGFALVRPPAGPTVALDFRETAPSSLTRPSFDAMIAAKGSGPVAAGVPGSVAGLLLAERRFGRLPLERVFAPAVALARDGVVLSPEEAGLLAAHWKTLSLDAAARAVFGDAHGAPLRPGARLKQPKLAALLRELVAHGEAAFYAGPAAESLVRATGGKISLADLAGYRALEREPIRIRYRGLDVETMPPPSAGGLVLAGTLHALEKLGPKPEPGTESAETLHFFLELSRRAQALRRFSVVDPDALDAAGQSALAARFLDPDALAAVPVDPEHATPSAKIHPLYAEALRELEHTTHLSVVDADGMVVSLTTTLSASFGAKLMVPATGVLLGNAVASFSSMGDNLPLPGRRTTSSMAPTLVLGGGRPLFVLGTPGGDTIPSTLGLLVMRLVDERMPLDDAVDAPRVHHGFVPDAVRYEAARPLAKGLLVALKAKGHALRRSRATQGDASVIALTNEPLSQAGYADPREGPGLALAAKARN
jgi:gamma-glutamyltranspeptidase/glutathione hydrolase